MCFDLRFTATQGTDDAEGKQFPVVEVQSPSCIYVTETKGTRIVSHDRFLIVRCRLVHLVNGIAKNGFLNTKAVSKATLFRDSPLTFHGKYTVLDEHFINDLQGTFSVLGKPMYGTH